MHVKVTTAGSRQYVQLVESYRDDAGRVKKRTVATLGRLDQLGGDLDFVIRGLMKTQAKIQAALLRLRLHSSRPRHMGTFGL